MDTNKDWSNLPIHQPDLDLWDRIDTELDLENVSGNLGKLPKHSAGLSVWNSINKKLIFEHYLRYFYIAGIGIAAIVLFFIFMNTSGNHRKSNSSNRSKVNDQTENQNVISKQNILSNATPSDVSDKRNANSLGKNLKNKTLFIKLPNDKLEKINSIQNELKEAEEIKSGNNINPGSTVNQPIKRLVIENQQNQNNKANDHLLVSNVLTDTNQTVTMDDIHKDQHNQRVISPETLNENTITTAAKVKSDTNQDANNIITIETNGIDPRKVHLKATNQPVKKGMYTIGADYTISKIYNPDRFAYADNKTMGQYGITLKYNYSHWFIQTGVNFSKFSDYLNYNSDQKLNQFRTYNYVDSVIYNPQGAIIQYITHPVTFNDSVLFQQLINATKKYSLMNIPLMFGYQYGYGRFSLSLKAGIMCTFIISEKETILLPDIQNVSVLKVYSDITSIRRTNWAGVLSAEIDYHINKRWGISIEPMLQYYFKPNYNEMDINNNIHNSSPYLMGVKTGLFYKFK